MGLFIPLLMSLLHLFLLAFDLLMLLLVVQLAAMRWPWSWLQAAAAISRPVADQLLRHSPVTLNGSPAQTRILLVGWLLGLGALRTILLLVWIGLSN